MASFGRGSKPADRRSENRLPAHGLVSIRLDGARTEPESVSLLGISEHGFSFRAATRLSPGQMIVAEPQECASDVFEPVEAVVRHCSSESDGFIIGAEILSHDKGSPEAGGDAEAEVVDESESV